MKNRSDLRRAQLKEKYGDLIAKSAKWLERERERELERIAKAARDAAVPEQNLLDSDANEQARKKRSATRQQILFKTDRRASRRAMNAMKKTVEIADVTSDSPLLTAEISKLADSSSRTVSEDVTVQETEDDVEEFLKSIMQSPVDQ